MLLKILSNLKSENQKYNIVITLTQVRIYNLKMP